MILLNNQYRLYFLLCSFPMFFHKKMSRLLEFIVAGVPGINYLRAKSLLSKFHKIKDIFNADIGDLMETPNIGKKLAQEIYKIANFKYQNDKVE